MAKRKKMLLSPRSRKWPFQAPKALRFKGKMSNSEAKMLIKQGKYAKRTNGTHFTRVQVGAREIGTICPFGAFFPQF